MPRTDASSRHRPRMRMLRIFVAVVVMYCGLAGGLPRVAQAADLVLPLERSTYVRREIVPLGLAALDDGEPLAARKVELLGEDGRRWLVYQGPAGPILLDTSDYAPGSYTFYVDEQATGVTLRVVSPITLSSGVVVGQGVYRPDEPNANTAEAPADPGEGAADAPKAVDLPDMLILQGILPEVRDGHSNAFAGMRYAPADGLLAHGASFLVHPGSRALGAWPARGSEASLQAYRHRLVLYAQANARHPNFAGLSLDHGAAHLFGAVAAAGDTLSRSTDRAFHAWSERRDRALFDLFAQRTGLEGVTEASYLKYLATIGRPLFAPVRDYPGYRWMEEIGAALPTMEPEALASLQNRQYAWSSFLMDLVSENYAGHQQALQNVVPGLHQTSWMNLDAAAARLGLWAPQFYDPLDIRYTAAAPPGPLDEGIEQSWQWLFRAGVLDIGRDRGQPIWLTTPALPGAAPYPGRFMRIAGHILAYGGRGLGLVTGDAAAEAAATQAPSYDAAAEASSAGSALLRRYAPLVQQGRRVRRVAVLMSRWQMAQQHLEGGIETPQAQVFTALARLGYTPRLITEDQILGGGLDGVQVLVIVNQTAELAPDLGAQVHERLAAFIRAGGRILQDRSSTLAIPGAAPMDVALPFKRHGLPANWWEANAPGLKPATLAQRRFERLAPPLLAAVGTPARSILHAPPAAVGRISTFEISGGKDASYVIAVSELIDGSQVRWIRQRETLIPQAGASGVVYDLTKEEALGALRAVECVFEDLPVRVLGVLSRAAGALDLKVTQSLRAGDTGRMVLRVLDDQGQPLQAVIPVTIELRAAADVQGQGRLVGRFIRTTREDGLLAHEWAVPATATPGQWELSVRSMLDGMTVSLPVTVTEAAPRAATAVSEKVLVRGRERIAALVATEAPLALPLFPVAPNNAQGAGEDAAEREARRHVLTTELQQRASLLGLKLEVQIDPPIGTYRVAYELSAASQAENARALAGETIARITVESDPRIGDYEAVEAGYIYGRHVLLLDLVQPDEHGGDQYHDNPLVEQLHRQGLLWPRVGQVFPGPGRALVQIVKSAFAPGADAIVIQATDRWGLEAGALALVDLPQLDLGTSTAQARVAMAAQTHVSRRDRPAVSSDGLTSLGSRTSRAPQPLALRFSASQPPTADSLTPPSAPASPPVPVVPVMLTSIGTDLSAWYRIGDRFVPTTQPYPGDCRYFDALGVRLKVPEAGVWKVTVGGIFRYADRMPQRAPRWDAVHRLLEELPRERVDMGIDVFCNGRSVGRLTATATARATILAQAHPQRTRRESVVTTLSGSIELPEGDCELHLAPQHMVDGKITSVTIDR